MPLVSVTHREKENAVCVNQTHHAFEMIHSCPTSVKGDVRVRTLGGKGPELGHVMVSVWIGQAPIMLSTSMCVDVCV